MWWNRVLSPLLEKGWFGRQPLVEAADTVVSPVTFSAEINLTGAGNEN